MKKLLAIALLVCPLLVHGQAPIQVGKGTVTTSPGIGGYADVGFAFAKGDVVHIQAQSSKKLQRMLVLLFPSRELGKTEETDHPKLTFTMPAEGIVVFRFISDRSGENKVQYQVTRQPSDSKWAKYDTRVVWLKPANGAMGDLVPVRANSKYDPSRVVHLIE